MRKEEVTGRGYLIGLTFWIVIIISMSSEFFCLPSCGVSDLALAAILGAGFLAPCLLVIAPLASDLLKDCRLCEWIKENIGFYLAVAVVFLLVAVPTYYHFAAN